MNAASRFVHNLESVSFVHVALVVALILSPLIHKLFAKKPELVIPVEFCVEVPDSSLVDDLHKLLAESKPDDIPPPAPVKKPPVKKVEKPPIKKSTRRVPLKPSPKPAANKLTPDQIRRLLAMGATPSDHTSIPPEELRCMELIRQALYDAWEQPSYAEVGGAMAEIEVRLQKDGSVFGARLTKKSGNAVLDASALRAATSVRHIGGLTPAFLQRYEDVTVAFKVEPE